MARVMKCSNTPGPVVVVVMVVVVMILMTYHTTATSTQTWQKVVMSESELAGEVLLTSLDNTPTSVLQCGAVANLTQEANAFCVPAPGVCLIYQLSLEGLRGELSAGPHRNCWALQRCAEGSQVVGGGCASVSACQGGVWRPYRGYGWALNMTIDELKNANCIDLYNIPRPWQKARDKCRQTGGDLLVAQDIQQLMVYTDGRRIDNLWVGVYKGQWLDGRPVGEAEWDAEEPDGGGEDCGMVMEGGRVRDDLCTRNKQFLCLKSVTYP